MGNTTSSPVEVREARAAHKLSKPRTGNVSTANLLSPGSNANPAGNGSKSSRLSIQVLPFGARSSTSLAPPAASSRDSGSTGPTVGRRDSSVSAKQKETKRKSIFRTRSSNVPSAATSRRSSFSSPAPGPDTMGRANSMVEPGSASVRPAAVEIPPLPVPPSPVPGSRLSRSYNMTSYEAKRLLNLDEETQMAPGIAVSENGMALSDYASKVPDSASAAGMPVPRTDSDMSLYTPVRRRSLIQTPGVATRSQSAHDRVVTSRQSARYSHPATPSISRKQSFESHWGGVISMPPPSLDPDSQPRAVTPSDSEYQSIGAFKLGSLRITNGNASPDTPELERHRRHGYNVQATIASDNVDYFSQRRARRASEARMAAQEQEERHRSLPEGREPSLDVPVLSPIPTLPSLGFGDSNSSSFPFEERSTNVAESPANYLSRDDSGLFMADSPALRTTSKNTAMEDRLFDDDAQPEYSLPEVIDVRLDPTTKIQQEQQPRDGKVYAAIDRADSGFVSGDVSPLADVLPRPLTKADSGYSSTVSLRSIRAKSQIYETDFASSFERQDLRRPKSAIVSRDVMASQRVSSQSAMPKDSPPHSRRSSLPRTSSIDDVLLTRRAASESTKHLPDLSIDLPRDEAASPFAVPAALQTPVSARSIKSSKSTKSTKSDKSGSALSIGSASQKPNKLQRLLSGARRPMSTGPLTVYATHTFENNPIPSIPQDMQYKLHEHTGMFPMTTKRLALKTRTSKDTLKTILSVGSFDMGFDVVTAKSKTSVVPKNVNERPKTSRSDRRHTFQTFQTVPLAVANAGTHTIPRKPVARKSLPEVSSVRRILPDVSSRKSLVDMSTRKSSSDMSARKSVAEMSARKSTSDVSVPVREKEKAVGNPAESESESILAVETELFAYSTINASLGHNAYDAAVAAMRSERRASLPVQLMRERTRSMANLGEPSAGNTAVAAPAAPTTPAPPVPAPAASVAPAAPAAPATSAAPAPPAAPPAAPTASAASTAPAPSASGSVPEPRSKRAPPVSMMTSRSATHLPSTSQMSSGNAKGKSLSRNSSQESISNRRQSYQPGTQARSARPVGNVDNGSISRRNSREGVYGQHSHAPRAQASAENVMNVPPIPTLNPRRSMNLQRSQTPGSYQTRNPTPGMQTPQSMSRPASRANSVLNGQGQRPTHEFQRGESAPAAQSQSHSHQQQHQQQQQQQHQNQHHVPHGYHPGHEEARHHGQNRPDNYNRSRTPNGRMHPQKPFDLWGSDQFDPSAAGWDGQGRYPTPPPVPGEGNSQFPPPQSNDRHGQYPLPQAAPPGRHPTPHRGQTPPPQNDPKRFHRARSAGRSERNNLNTPYRILHSYNSPAYRNAPIWG